MATFIAIDENGSSGVGESLDGAFENLEDEVGEVDFNEVTFYVATPMEVERRIIEKETIIPATPPRTNKK